jgi:hypothetical protein
MLLAIGIAGACASPPEKYTEDEIQQAASVGALPEIYDRIAADLASPEWNEQQRQTLQLRLEEVGRGLAENAENEITATLGDSVLASGLAPLEAYRAQQLRLASIKRWDATIYQRVAAGLSQGEQQTRDAISVKRAELEPLSATQVEEKVSLFDELGALYGEGAEEQIGYAEQKSLALGALRAEVLQAIAGEDYDAAQRALKILAVLNPTDPFVQANLAEVDAKLFEDRFYAGVEKRELEDAYEALVALSGLETFDKIRTRLAGSGVVLADELLRQGAGAVKARNWQDAFRYFSQSRDTRHLLGIAKSGRGIEEHAFIHQMHKRFKQADQQGLYGLALGYLNVISEIQPNRGGLRRELREIREKVLRKAAKRLSVAPFGDKHGSGSEFGSTVTAKVVKHLFENLSEDVRIIEREKLAEIEKERVLSVDTAALEAVHYLVQGNVLQAKVDSIERLGRQRKWVATGEETVTNPNWDRWNSMDQDERGRAGLVTQPPRVLTQDKMEDISIATAYHRKVGVFSVSYRVIDARTAKLVFADTQRAKAEREDTGSDGVDFGTFHQKFKVANLPSDVEMLEQLAERISEAVGTRLAALFVDPELRYEKRGDRFFREGNFLDASQQYAYALVLMDRKNQDSTHLLTNLRTSAVSAGIGP